MSLVDALLNSSASDVELIASNEQKGDHSEVPRDVDFVLEAKTEGKASLMCSFIVDNHYGRPSFQRVDLENGETIWRVITVIHTPATKHVICSLNGLFVCLAELFGLEYNGWGCLLQNET
ncbi:ribonuclease E inhibitor RraB [Brevifollis gellanilyticus]|uniref:Regulator of ribonuclease activity B domain-containing protein n=1 Tax=Brevifollis gellanilyticus TaxID=748831 RepID=A0A512MF53_9BACT|nr:ribonuclease E inhibitor RraB [Brevifollis gellanilyticus]GEP45352.1 hypothetical protein BGE01nite_46430 [Brevifollis gellanilyticus]